MEPQILLPPVPRERPPPVIPDLQAKKQIIFSKIQSPGVTVCRDSIKPTELYLRGHDIRVDHEAGYTHLPAFHVEEGRAIGPRCTPLVVLIATGEFLFDIPSVRQWDGISPGVFTCPSELKAVFRRADVIWITNSRDIRSIRRSENGYKQVASLVIKKLDGPSRLKKWVVSFLKFLRLVSAVGVASSL